MTGGPARPKKSSMGALTRSYVPRPEGSELDVPLADVVARWLATDWPCERVDHRGR
jgi:hypothetical protein